MTVLNAIAIEVYLEDEFSPIASNSTWQPDYWAENLSRWTSTWLATLTSDLPKAAGYELTLRFTDDGEIQRFNAQYRHQDKATDVLSFPTLDISLPLIPDNLEEFLYLGDVLVSVETAQRQAEERGHSLNEELGWLVTHGLLHLLGWDHPDEASLHQMLAQQETLLRLVGLVPQDL